MILKFLGSKANVEEYSNKPPHKYHSSLLIEYKKFKLLIDHGTMSKKTIGEINPNAVLITHAHPDHYIWALKDEKTKIPVYASKETIDYGKAKPRNFKIIKAGKKFKLGNFIIFPFRVLHSIRCPGIGFRISTGKKVIIYTGDLVDIVNKDKIMKNADYYIGDGSSIRANLVRKKGSKLFGHARIATQINWCKKYNIPENHIIFTHLGKETIANEKQFRKINPEIRFAYDEMKLKLE